MVILERRAMVHQAARAMADNHIGAVLVSQPPGIVGILTDRDLALAVLGGELDPRTTRLGEVMSEEVVTCDIGADLDEVVRLMREHRVRRIPLTEGGRPVGLVTFDDLVLDGSVGLDALRGIITAQLEVEAPKKPEGALHPQATVTAEGRARALMRAKARAEATYNRMVAAVAEASGLDRARAERALFTATCMLCRRLTTEEAQDLIAQLPSLLRRGLDDCLGRPDRAVTAQAISGELARTLGLTAAEAGKVLRAVFEVIARSVSAGQIEEVRGQLPEEMKALFPARE
ncbi:MAG: DUF2267 domain-containing protein [Acetobacteraceae bacterium]|nr:DUF2267 domain-containing protein [Acetobacteraceae bacterium]